MSIFEQLKRNKIAAAQTYFSAKEGDKIFFKLRFDNNGAYLETVNHLGEEAVFDYRRFSGVLRSPAKNIQLTKDRSDFTIDWENPDNHLYLHEHPYLVTQLLESGHFINEQMQPVLQLPGSASLSLKLIKENEGHLSATGAPRLSTGAMPRTT